METTREEPALQHVRTPVLPDPACNRCPHGYSAKDKQILRYIAGGLTTPRIAEAMKISSAAVKSHINKMMMRLSCETRPQLLNEAFACEIIDIRMREENEETDSS